MQIAYYTEEIGRQYHTFSEGMCELCPGVGLPRELEGEVEGRGGKRPLFDFLRDGSLPLFRPRYT